MSCEETKETRSSSKQKPKETRSSKHKQEAIPWKKPRKPPRKDLTHRPQRALTAFEFFAREYRAEANNNVSASAAWKGMADEEKEPYLVMGGNAAALEQKQKWEIEFGQGYYVLEDGSKSTDDKNKTLSAKEQLDSREKQS